MKTSKEFFERMQSDEAFAQEIIAALQAKREAGAKNYYETFIPVAQEHGYEITREELDEIYAAQATELTDEELGKVAGGMSCFGWVITTIIGTIVSSMMSLGATISWNAQ